MFRAGGSFSDIERVIDEVADLPLDKRDALWLYAFSLRNRAHSPSLDGSPVPA